MQEYWQSETVYQKVECHSHLYVIKISAFTMPICLLSGPQSRQQKLLPFTNSFYTDNNNKKINLHYKEQSLLNSDIKSY